VEQLNHTPNRSAHGHSHCFDPGTASTRADPEAPRPWFRTNSGRILNS